MSKQQGLADGIDPQKLQAIWEATTEGIVLVTKDRKIDLANRRLEEMFGYKTGELIGNSTEHQGACGSGFPRVWPTFAGTELEPWPY